MPSILNISAYLFTPLPDAAALRETLQGHAQGLQLKGTILLAHEGIYLFLAGLAEQVRRWRPKRVGPMSSLSRKCW